MQEAIVQSGIGETSVGAVSGDDLKSNDRGLEPAVARTRLHWIVFAPPAACLALSAVLLLCGMAFEVIGGFTFLFAVAAIASAGFDYASSDFALTEDRLLMKTGFIRRSVLEIQLGAIEGIQVQQGFFGRILGFGSILLSGNGGWQYPYHRISAPSTFCTQVEQLSGVSAGR